MKNNLRQLVVSWKGINFRIMTMRIKLDKDWTKDGNFEPEIKKRINRAAFTFRSLATRCFDRKGLSSNTKIAVYKAIILPTLLYGSETWPTLQHHIHMLEVYHQRSLQRLTKVKWCQHVTNTEVLQRAKCTTIQTIKYTLFPGIFY